MHEVKKEYHINVNENIPLKLTADVRLCSSWKKLINLRVWMIRWRSPDRKPKIRMTVTIVDNEYFYRPPLLIRPITQKERAAAEISLFTQAQRESLEEYDFLKRGRPIPRRSKITV
jgi:hypothetical protein